MELHQWCNGYRGHLECVQIIGSSPGWVKPKSMKLVCVCFTAEHAALRRKSKDWLALNQNNVSEWSEMSTR